MYILSKSSFLRGIQCVKSLYLNNYNKELQTSISISQNVIFEQGEQVGKLARQLFSNGRDVSIKEHFTYQDSVLKTHKLLEHTEAIIYEGAFLYDEVFVATDILVKEQLSCNAYEVKSSTELKEAHIFDAALQYYVITNSGISLNDFSIIYINNKYTYSGVFEIRNFFIIKSVLKEVKELQPLIEQKLKDFKAVLGINKIPAIDIGTYCNNPHPCDFIKHCWKHIPPNSIFEIANLSEKRKFELYYQGIIELNKIPHDFNLSENQWQQIYSELEQKEIIEKEKIKNFVDNLVYPISFLDFETFQLAIPQFQKSKPFQQLVFQYSLHKLTDESDELIHYEFIAEINSIDPRIPFINKLVKDCDQKGDILVYNISFEKTRLLELANIFPEFSTSIQGIINRLKDLMTPFKERWYYKPSMKGSYSIKVVLPSLFPELSYDNLEIKDGATASSIYSSLIQGTFGGESKRVIQSLLKYCEQDTLAMVKVLERLKSISLS